jgi:hypothetical protein
VIAPTAGFWNDNDVEMMAMEAGSKVASRTFYFLF